ncbi:MAG TPA: hypothetical protein VGK48_20265, partial [Terriglobia bacterium]
MSKAVAEQQWFEADGKPVLLNGPAVVMGIIGQGPIQVSGPEGLLVAQGVLLEGPVYLKDEKWSLRVNGPAIVTYCK